MVSAILWLLVLLTISPPLLSLSNKATIAKRALHLPPSTCITKTKRPAQQRSHNDDLNTGNNLLQLEERASGARKWNGRRVVYEIVNGPVCSDQLDEGDVRRIVGAAVATWNSVPLANVLLVNIDDLPQEELVPVSPTIDIKISFQPCVHKDPNQRFDQDFNPCADEYAHAIHFGDVHLNTLMSWSEQTGLTTVVTQQGDRVKPNLYSIVLHELGHVLGLSHSQFPTQAMYGRFGGDRKYSVLGLGDEDVKRLQELYPTKTPWECQDKSVVCRNEDLDVCGSEETRAFCPATCGSCKCDEDTPDDYLKCSQDICSDARQGHMKEFCKKTCNLCGSSPPPPTCTGLPPPVSKLTTSVQFPVTAGTVVGVSCPARFVLVGDAAITCVEGETFSFTTQPKCELEDEGPNNLVMCRDIYSQCDRLLKKGRKCKNKFLKKKCKLTCNRCK